MNRFFVSIFNLCLVTSLILLLASPAISTSFNGLAEKPRYDKLESALSRYLEILEDRGQTAAHDFAEQNNILIENGAIYCALKLRGGYYTSDLPVSQFSIYGVRIDSKSKNFIEVWIPEQNIVKFAQSMPQVSQISRPQKAVSYVTSEALDLFGADTYHDANVRGEGVRVGIIDGGFAGWVGLQEDDEIPQFNYVNYSPEDMNEGGEHGAACFEVVADVAPNAEFTLFKVWTSSHFERTLDYALANQIDLISMSIGWELPIDDYFNGDDRLSQAVDEAFDNGLLIVQSAGNSAHAHYRNQFNDNGEDDHYHRYNDGGTINPIGDGPGDYISLPRGTVLNMSLIWDDFPDTDQDFDLELVRVVNGEAEVVATSDSRQNGNDDPTEQIRFVVEERGYYGVRVLRFDADNGMDFTLIGYPYDLGYYNPSGSLTVPSMAEHCLAVGAVNYRDWDDQDPDIAYYSSQGPSYDGRIKPNVVAPDGVSTVVYGLRSFYGTSCACPHTAGAAALVLSNHPLMDNAGLWDYMIANAVDAGENGADNVFGFGMISIEWEEPNPDNHPDIALEPEAFESEDGGVYDLSIANNGQANLVWSSVVNYHQGDGWLSLSSTQGTIRPERSSDLELNIIREGLEEGDYTADLLIVSNDPDDDMIEIPVVLHALGDPFPIIEVSDASIDFEDADINVIHRFNLVIYNRGRADLTVFDISIEGVGFSIDFHGTDIAPGHQYTLPVTFIPANIGEVNGALTISSTDDNNDPVIVPLHGNGVNSPPVVDAPIADMVIDEDAGWILGDDLDDVFDDANGNIVEYSIVSAPENLHLTLDGDNVLNFEPALDWNAPEGFEVTLSATDAYDLTAEEVFTVVINPVNDAPRLAAPLEPANGTELDETDIPLTFSWNEALDVDGDALLYSWYLQVDYRETDTILTVTELNQAEYTVNNLRSFLIDLGVYHPDAGYRVNLQWWHGATDGEEYTESNEHWRLNVPVPVSVKDEGMNIPEAFALSSIYPNPFNSATVITYALPRMSSVNLQVFNISGQLVFSDVKGNQQAGIHAITWNALDDPPGLYFLRLSDGNASIVRKVTLMK